MPIPCEESRCRNGAADAVILFHAPPAIKSPTAALSRVDALHFENRVGGIPIGCRLEMLSAVKRQILGNRGQPVLRRVEKPQNGDLMFRDLKHGQVPVPAGSTPDGQIAKIRAAGDRSASHLGTSESRYRSLQKMEITVRNGPGRSSRRSTARYRGAFAGRR